MRLADAYRILIVDDDNAFRLSTAELLRQDGYVVAAAADAAEAGEALVSRDFDLPKERASGAEIASSRTELLWWCSNREV